MTMDSEEFKICSVGQQTWDQESSARLNADRQRPRKEMVLWTKSEGSLLENFLLIQEASPLVLLRTSADLKRLTYIMEGNLLYQHSLT